MDKKEKTALLATILNTIITLLKFFLYTVSGSLAILAEAWHSFSDIATSILVFISLKFSKNKTVSKFKIISIEQIAAFLIGWLLLIVSYEVFKKIFYFKKVLIKNPLYCGLAFIFFSLLSYIVYKIENKVGKEQKSISLIADSLHSKSDVVISLLTGFSLILYTLGLDIDKYVAILISILIFSFAIEILVNLIITIIKSKEIVEMDFRTRKLIVSLFDKDFWDSISNKLFKDEKIKQNFFIKIIFSNWIIVIILLLLYLSTMTYKIDFNQEGILEKYGKLVNKNNPVQPGQHFKLPFPFERVIKINSKSIQSVYLGNKTGENAFALLWTVEHGAETPFLTGDNNYLYPYVVVTYKIQDIFKYYYSKVDMKKFLENYFERELNKYLIQNEFWKIVTNFRKELKELIYNDVQKNIEGLGIKIISVNFKDMHPPINIALSFENVVASFQEKERLINEAISYKNSEIPKAEANAYEKKLNALSYNIEKINKSEGETKRFELQLEALQTNKKIIEKFLLLKNVKEALSKNINKIIIDKDIDESELFLNSSDFFKGY